MREKIFFIVIFMSIFLISVVYAQNQIPDIILNQKIELNTYITEQNTTISLPKEVPFTTQLIDWRMSSEEESIEIAENFIKNSEAELGISFEDFKRVETIFTKQSDYDYLNPSGNIKYTQYYHDIPIYNSRFSINVNAYGVVVGFGVMDFEKIIKNITASTTPIISSDDAREIIEKHFNQTEFELEKNAELYIYENKLVWRFNILRPIFKEVMINSQNGEIALERKNIRDESQNLGTDNTPLDTGVKEKSQTSLYMIIGIFIIILIVIVSVILKTRKK